MITNVQSLLKWITEFGSPVTAEGVSEGMGIKINVARVLLGLLAAGGALAKNSNGAYELTGKPYVELKRKKREPKALQEADEPETPPENNEKTRALC